MTYEEEQTWREMAYKKKWERESPGSTERCLPYKGFIFKQSFTRSVCVEFFVECASGSTHSLIFGGLSG
uniref:Uncharacterized protein n=1 Tax=Arion vulgaris TaxID=1028688 RepID=A0A0B7B5H2_9EUPU